MSSLNNFCLSATSELLICMHVLSMNQIHVMEFLKDYFSADFFNKEYVPTFSLQATDILHVRIVYLLYIYRSLYSRNWCCVLEIVICR